MSGRCLSCGGKISSKWKWCTPCRNIIFKWIKNIQKGDVIVSPTGTYRVVREVKHQGHLITKTWVTLVILRCSWTHRCVTCMNGSDLACLGYRPTTGNFKLNTKFDKEIEHNISNHNDKTLDCCDVRGVA